MAGKVLRKIVHIDEEKCNGCGECVPNCVEGALQIIDGKAKLISETYCDGLGACLGKCPQDAITIEERWAEDFDEEATHSHMHELQQASREVPCACPSAAVRSLQETGSAPDYEGGARQPSTLTHWPVQLALVPPTAPFLQGADLLLAADCTAYAYPNFHRDFLKGHALLVACPKLDDFPAHLRKLTDIFARSGIRSVSVVHMEVPCCSGLVHMVRQALLAGGKAIPFNEVTIGVRGDIKRVEEGVKAG
jgi:Pyruvate/2-oxoacid:ferredoxin oxidoreductase delta subunit